MLSRAYPRSSGRSFGMGRILVALVVVAMSVVSYLSSRQFNPVTEETQYVAIDPEQEIVLGLEAAPEMTQEFGGLEPDPAIQGLVDDVCARIIQNSDVASTDWPFECNVLADQETINAFALPGGPVFITDALLNRLQTEGQLAGVLGHEIGHVVARHAAQQIAKQQLTQGITGAVVLATYDPQNPSSQQAAQMAMLVGQVVGLKYGRDDELQSDRLGVRFMSQAGYDPRSMIDVMKVLEEASAGNQPPEFFSTHPNPENRIARIQEAIAAEFPNGVPDGLIK